MGIRHAAVGLRVQNKVGSESSAIEMSADSIALADVPNNTTSLGDIKEFGTIGVYADKGVSGAGGRDTGTVGANEWWFMWVIWGSTPGLNGILSQGHEFPNPMPSGYTHATLAGACRTDGSGNFLRFYSRNMRHWWLEQWDTTLKVATSIGTNPAGIAVGHLVPVPVNTEVILGVEGGTCGSIYWLPYGGGGPAQRICGNPNNNTPDSRFAHVLKDPNGNVPMYADANGSCVIWVQGFIFSEHR